MPQCDLTNPLINGDCGTISDLTFGSTKPSTVIDPATFGGWGTRPYNWEFSTSVQRELNDARVGERRVLSSLFGNFTVTDTPAYPIPKVGVHVSAMFQSLPGPQIAANYTASNAEVQPSLGRPLSGGATNVTVNIVQSGTLYGERANQLDLRFEKILKFGKTRTFVDFDLYNIANASPVLTVNNSYGAWLTPLSILDTRLFKIAARFEF